MLTTPRPKQKLKRFKSETKIINQQIFRLSDKFAPYSIGGNRWRTTNYFLLKILVDKAIPMVGHLLTLFYINFYKAVHLWEFLI